MFIQSSSGVGDEVAYDLVKLVSVRLVRCFGVAAA